MKKKVLNIADHKPNVNIMPFGICNRTSPSKPCTVSTPSQWVNGKKDVRIGDNQKPALANDSFCVCSLGGIIKIVKDGQKVADNSKNKAANAATSATVVKSNVKVSNESDIEELKKK